MVNRHPLFQKVIILPRKCKCCLCKSDIDVDKAIIYTDINHKTPKKLKFCSNECMYKYISELEFKAQEKQDFADLCKYIINICDLKYIPNGFFIILNDLRNGTIRKNGIVIKNNKQGVQWSELLITYKYCSEKIKWALDNKDFKSDMAKLNYCLAIVKNNIDKAMFNYRKNKNDKDINIENIVLSGDSKYIYKAQENKNDISDIL